MKKEFPENSLKSKTSALQYYGHLPSAGCAETPWAVRYCPKGEDSTGRSQQPVPSRGSGDAQGEFTTH